MRVDMHIHTTASDGAWTPEELIEAALSKNIKVIAVTDHDSVTNVAQTMGLAAKHKLICIPGVEISTTLGEHSYHILGYGVDIKNQALLNLIKRNNNLIETADTNTIKTIVNKGLLSTADDYEKYTFLPARGGWKSLNYLIDKKICIDASDFFKNIFTKNMGLGFPNFLGPKETIKAIKDAGGIAVLAHPGSKFHGGNLLETLEAFRDVDIDGIECFHPNHDENQTKIIKQWCIRHQKLITGGSDSHGNFLGRSLGMPEVYLDNLNIGQLKRFF